MERVKYVLGLVAMFVGAFFGMPLAIGATLTVEAQVLTWQRVERLLELSGTPAAQQMFIAFKSWLMQQKGQLKLQFIAISDLTDDINSLDGAVRVYAIYLKKQGTATDAFFKLFDDAANSGTAGDERVTLPALEASKEVILFYPDGLPLADGVVITSHTSSNGTTDSTTGDGPNGFMLIGA